MRILIVEDDKKIAEAIKKGLQRQAFAVDIADNGDDGLAMAMNEPYGLIILDRMLPGSIDGIGLLQSLRSQNNTIPVLLLTAKDTVLDRASGLNAGADDYLVKPFAFVELIARVRALLRRPKAVLSDTLKYGDVELDSKNFTVTRDGKALELTSLEFSLLQHFMRNAGRTLSKDEIIKSVWDFDADILPNTVEVYVGYLRNKIEKPFPKKPVLITTKRGFGYVFGELG